MTVFFPFTNEGLKELFSQLLSQPDFLKVSRRDIVTSFLCTHLRCFGYVAMTHEELIVRRHFDYLGSSRPKARSVDVFHHENLFLQLGLASHERVARDMVQSTIGNLVSLGILKTDHGSDGQAGFLMTCLANPELSIDEAVFEVRRKLK